MSPRARSSHCRLRALLSGLAVCIGILAVAPAASAGESDEVSLQPGRVLRLVLEAGETVAVPFAGNVGTQVTLLARGHRGFEPVISVLDPTGESLAADLPGGRILARQLIATGGLHQVVVQAGDGAGGMVVLRVRVTVPSRMVIAADPDGSATVSLFSLGSLGPLHVTIRVPQGATLAVQSLIGPDGKPVDIAGKLTTTANGRLVRLGPLTTKYLGAHTVNLQLLGGDPPLPDEPPELIVRVRMRFTRSFGLR